MTKVTVKPHGGELQAMTPSERVIQDVQAEFSVQDERGRTLVLKKPDVLAQFDLIEALGDLAKNDVYRIMCIPAIYVVSIDGVIAPAPSNKAQMRALISRLGEEGFAAIKKGIAERFPQDEDGEGDEAVKK
ncbi:hypothetical protein [Pararobbsia alpina]|uniref:Uncharacterized protein n=1 Tax=Pararobbsia alpina TaxID=621374 RepID=A0A6S7B172_9BURK|nr:hypothetical protein [Pararobbsia alpina]CAB3784322.1 hypothetical protein LMG28138_01786 [Pararobbsia alpina]